MHSYVFQLSKSPVLKENRLIEEAILENIQNTLGINAVDYVEMLSEDERIDAITQLVCKWLPTELFNNNADGTFTYKGGLREWSIKVYIPMIKEASSLINPDNVFGIGVGSAYAVEKAIKNPLDLAALFITSENDYTSPAMQSGGFIEDFVKGLNPGDRIHVGTVLGYHF